LKKGKIPGAGIADTAKSKEEAAAIGNSVKKRTNRDAWKQPGGKGGMKKLRLAQNRTDLSGGEVDVVGIMAYTESEKGWRGIHCAEEKERGVLSVRCRNNWDVAGGTI